MLALEEIKAHLAADRSKSQVKKLVEQMARHHFDVQAYLSEIEREEMPMSWLLAWTLSHYVEAYPLRKPEEQARLVDVALSTRVGGIQRDLWRAISFLELHEDAEGRAYEKALTLIPSQSAPIAVRAHAIYVALRVVQRYPELASEFKMALGFCAEDPSAAIQARVRHAMKKLP